MSNVSFHPEYSKAKNSWSLLELNQTCERDLRSGNNIWVKGCINDSIPTVLCTEDETFILRKGKSSNITYLALDTSHDEKRSTKDEKMGDVSSLNNENCDSNGNLCCDSNNLKKNDMFLLGETNSVMFLTRTPGMTSQIRHIMDKHMNETGNKTSDIGFEDLLRRSQISVKELFEYLFDFNSMMLCDLNGKWYSVNYDILINLLSSILQKGMLEGVVFNEITLSSVKNLLYKEMIELKDNITSRYSLYCNTLEHALNSDFTLLQLIKHFIVIPKENKLFNLFSTEFNVENHMNLIKNDITKLINQFKDLPDIKIVLSHKRIQRIIAIHILDKNPILKVRDYVQKFQEMSSDYIPLEVYEMEFEGNNACSANKINSTDLENYNSINTDSEEEIDLYFGFPSIENHPDNTGIRFDILSGNAYYNEEDDTIRYLPCFELPTDPRNRLATLFTKKKYWSISEISSFISPILSSETKIEEFCLTNCYFFDKNTSDKNSRLFYNKNLPLFQRDVT